MDPNMRIRKAPPIPKFKDASKEDTQQVQAKVTNFLNQISKETEISKSEHKNSAKPVQHPTKNVQTSAIKKFSMSSINSKLNSLLTAKNINLNKVQSIPKSQQETFSANTPSIQQQYDPEVPNSYEKFTSVNSELLNKYTKLYENGQQQNGRFIENQKISNWIKQYEMTDESQDYDYAIENDKDVILEEKEEIALRIMQKHGFKVGEGLGKRSQGLQTPLIAKKVTDSSCVIQPSILSLTRYISPEHSAQNALKAFKVQKTRVIVLVVPDLKIGELTEDIETEIKQECSAENKIKEWVMVSLEQSLRIFVMLESIQECFRLFMRINGRYYDQKRIMVHFYDQEEFLNKKFALPLHNPIQI